MDDHGFSPTKFIWTAVASFAGSITALSFRLWQKMTPFEIGLALFVGTTFAIFVTPLFISLWPAKPKGDDLQVLGGIYYLLASAWNILLPVVIVRIKRIVAGVADEKESPT